MIGIFDSGVGGLASFREVRRLLPSEDIAYLADRENAPYGTKRRDELIRLVTEDINRLSALGCSHILIACCTASTVYNELGQEHRAVAFPIITPTARLAAEKQRVTVIATEHTVASGAFSQAIREAQRELVGLGADADGATQVTEIAAQPLVALVEEGGRDARLNAAASRLIDRLAEQIRATDPEALVLGCTHFSHLKGELQSRLPGVCMLVPATVGARSFVAQYERTRPTGEGKRLGRGKNIYLEGCRKAKSFI